MRRARVGRRHRWPAFFVWSHKNRWARRLVGHRPFAWPHIHRQEGHHLWRGRRQSGNIKSIWNSPIVIGRLFLVSNTAKRQLKKKEFLLKNAPPSVKPIKYFKVIVFKTFQNSQSKECKIWYFPLKQLW
jgi:hypothetical protein